MVKSAIFGSVLVMLLSSSSIAANPLTESYDAIEQRRKTCLEMAESGHKEFPESNWLDSLEEPKKTEVLEYLVMASFNQCLESQIADFKHELSKQSIDVQTFIKKYVSVEPFVIRVPSDIERTKLDELSSNVTKPFKIMDLRQ